MVEKSRYMWTFRKSKINGIILALIIHSIQLIKLFNCLKWQFSLFTQFGVYFQIFPKFKWIYKFTRVRKYGKLFVSGKALTSEAMMNVPDFLHDALANPTKSAYGSG